MGRKPQPFRPGVYCITCVANGRKYIGISQRPTTRLVDHKSALRGGRHAIASLQDDFRRFGESSFLFEVLETFSTRREAIANETKILESEWHTMKLYNRRITAIPKRHASQAAVGQLIENLKKALPS